MKFQIRRLILGQLILTMKEYRESKEVVILGKTKNGKMIKIPDL